MAAGSAEQSGWKTYCDRKLGFLIRYPQEMELKVEPSKTTAEGQFNLAEWRSSKSKWSVVLHLHEPPPERKTPPLREWSRDLGGDQAEATLAGNIPAVLRTSLFEAVFEKSVFFIEQSQRRIMEIRLTVPNIADWMGAAETVAPQYRGQEQIFDRMVDSIRVGECP